MTIGASGTDIAPARLWLTTAGRRRITRRIPTRRGTVYVAVLGVALIVSVIGLAAMHIARIETRAAVTANDMAHAQLMAQSAIEYALGRVELAGSSWRTTFVHGEEVPPDDWIELGHGRLKFVLLDDDGDLADDATDHAVVRGIGRAGGATSVTTLTLAPAGSGLNCLEAALHSVGTLSVDGATLSGTGLVSATAGVEANNANIQLPVETSGTASGSAYNGGSPSEGVPQRNTPEPLAVIEYYLDNGTWINFSDVAGGSGIMDRVVLTKGNNPFGATTNSQGIYVIDCLGNDITIQNSRIEGTLVLLNSGSGSSVTGRIRWDAAAANYPAMLVLGDMQFNANVLLALDETVLNTNFNPVGSPFEGAEDSDKADSYVGMIRGLVYVSGSLAITNNTVVDGVIVVGNQSTITQKTTVTYRDTFFNNPPPGFADGSSMRLYPGSWSRSEY